MLNTWIMKWKKLIESLTYEKKIYTLLMGLVTIPLLFMGILSYVIYVRGESEKVQITLNAYGDEISNEYENIFSAIRDYYIETVNTDAVRWLTYQEDVPYSKYSNLKHARSALEGSYFMEKYIENFEYINLEYGWVFNPYGLFDYQDMQNRQETDWFLAEQMNIPLSVYWQNETETIKPVKDKMRISNTVDSSGMQLVVKKEKGISTLSSIFLVGLDEEALIKMADNYQNLGYDITILRDDEVFLQNNENMAQWCLKHQEKDEGDLVTMSDGSKYRLYVQEGSSTGLTYVIGYDTSQVRKDGTVFVVASVMVVTAFGLLLLLIRLTAGGFAKHLQKLESFVGIQNGKIKELLVSNMLKGEASEEKIQETLKSLEIEPREVYRMIVMNCKANGWEERELRRKLEEIFVRIPDEIRNSLFITPLIYREKLVFLVGSDCDGDIDFATAELYKALKDYIAEEFGLSMASGISQPFHKLHHTGRAYSECAQALYHKSNQADADNSSLVLYDDYLRNKQRSNVYDLIMESELTQAIKSCNEKEAVRLMEMIVWRMDAKNVAGIERSLYLSRMMAAVLEIPTAAGIALTDVFDSEHYNVMHQIMQTYEKKKMMTMMSQELIGPIIQTLQKKYQEEDQSETVKALLKLLKESKGNISLNECADQLNYHPNYLSKILKKEHGMTFTDLANEEKMKQARYMLLATDDSIAEIAEKLQYNNVQNFIRFFKNQAGVTPAVFRREHTE